MNVLQRLKKRLFNQEADDQQQVYGLCLVMEICGGYDKLLNLSLPTVKHILKFLEFRAKEEKKAMKTK